MSPSSSWAPCSIDSAPALRQFRRPSPAKAWQETLREKVLNRLCTSVKAVPKTFSRKGMAGNFASLLVRFIDNRADFLCGESGRTYQFAVAGEMKIVGRVQFDQVRVVRNLVPHRFAGGPGRVHD